MSLLIDIVLMEKSVNKYYVEIPLLEQLKIKDRLTTQKAAQQILEVLREKLTMGRRGIAELS